MLSSEILRAVAAERIERMRTEAERARLDRSLVGRDGGRRHGRAERTPAPGPDEVYPDEPTRPPAGRRAHTGRGR